MSFELKALPFPPDALEPYIGRRTVQFHYEKHHRGYVDKLNKAIAADRGLDRDLETLIKTLPPGKPFNFAAQVWNHDFYWQSIGPGGGGGPHGALAERIKEDFGSIGRLEQKLAEAAKDEFGSGWAWLAVGGDERLRVLSTTDAENPLQSAMVPLLAIDVWEHAYYLDYQHERGKYIEAYLDHLVQWRFAAETYDRHREAAKAGAEVS